MGRATRSDQAFESTPHLLRMPQHVLRDHPEGRQSLCGSRSIPSTISPLGAPARVVALAVALDDEPAVDEEIDEADAVDLHLTIEAAAERTKDESHEGLRSGACPGIEQGPEAPEPSWKGREELIEIVGIEHTEMERGVDGRDRDPGRLADHGIVDGVERLDDEGVRIRIAQKFPPVQTVRPRHRPQACSGCRHMDVNALGLENEHAATP